MKYYNLISFYLNSQSITSLVIIDLKCKIKIPNLFFFSFSDDEYVSEEVYMFHHLTVDFLLGPQ
jgi:hypothetical protein